MDWGEGNRTKNVNNETVALKNCKYFVSYDNTCANVDSYVKCLFNVANTSVQSNSSVPNVNSCNMGHNERFPMFVRETGVEEDHYIVLPDLGHWGQLMTSDTLYTCHPCKVNCLQSRTFDGLQPHQCNFNSLESMRQGVLLSKQLASPKRSLHFQ